MIDLLKEVNIHFTYFAVFLSLLLAVAEWIKREPDSKTGKRQKPGYLFYTALIIASVQWRLGMLLSGFIIEVPFLTFLLPSSIFLAGPIIFKMAMKMVEFTYETKREIKYHFIPAVIALGYDIYFQSKPFAEQKLLLQKSLYEGEFTLLNFGLFLGGLHVGFYFFRMLYLNYHLNKEYDIRYTKLVYAILITPLLGIIILGIRFFYPSLLLSHLGALSISASTAFIYLFMAKYPNFFVTLQANIRKQKYESTLLTGINVEAICTRLKELMEEDQLFLDETLRLDDLADECLISRHQLSRILNEQFGKNFNEFVNYYRVEEAKKRLIEKPDVSVLMIGYEVGFNTKTT
ncbi:MAG: helix-turn-helix domain-containing protein, partial [Candidatus Hydrogenedentota bacterium]